jgi:hypothetical protein
MYEFIIIFILAIILGYFLERFLINLLGFSIFRFIIAPGIFIHEASHALFIIIFRGKIKTFKIFKLDGGEVTYTKPLYPLISQPIIAMAPVLGCSLALYFSGKLLGFNFNNLHPTFNINNLLIFRNFLHFNLNSLIFLYLVLSFTSAMAPSKKDFSNAISGLVLILIILSAIYYYIPATHIIISKMSYIYLVGLYMVILAIVICLAIWIFKMIFKKILIRN